MIGFYVCFLEEMLSFDKTLDEYLLTDNFFGRFKRHVMIKIKARMK